MRLKAQKGPNRLHHLKQKGEYLVYYPKTAKEFLKWRDENPRGFIVNVGSKGPMLHDANCFYLTWIEQDTRIERLDINWVKNQKVCSMSRNELTGIYGSRLLYCWCQKRKK